MDDDFGSDDVLRITTMYGRRLEMGLRWWKDSLTEAIEIKDSSEASANMGSMGEPRVNFQETVSFIYGIRRSESFQNFGRMDLQQFPKYSCTKQDLVGEWTWPQANTCITFFSLRSYSPQTHRQRTQNIVTSDYAATSTSCIRSSRSEHCYRVITLRHFAPTSLSIPSATPVRLGTI
jgi:hypothetical protein